MESTSPTHIMTSRHFEPSVFHVVTASTCRPRSRLATWILAGALAVVSCTVGQAQESAATAPANSPPAAPTAAAPPTTSLATSLVTPLVNGWLTEQMPRLIELYQELHRHPELSLHEMWTAKKIAEQLRQIGCEVREQVGGQGVVGLLRNGDGPTVMLRCDLDGLPVTEMTSLPYASTVRTSDDQGLDVGVMHACGHDLHMTNMLAVAGFLAEHREVWRGTLLLVGQPAEEKGAGAKAMLAAGLFTEFPRPDFALALHVDAALEAGKIGCREGFTLANVDSVDITLHGKGGHGAYPHTTIDPVVQAAHLIVDLQSIVSREVSPTEPAVITVGSIHGGTKHNVIGDKCHLQLTVRSYRPEVRTLLLSGIERKAKAAAASAGAPDPVITVTEGTPAVNNDPTLTRRLRPVFEQALGTPRVEEAELSMGGEDFSRYGLAGVPSLMYRLGCVSPERLLRYSQLSQSPPSLHSAQFYPDVAEALPVGVLSMVAAVVELAPAKLADSQ